MLFNKVFNAIWRILSLVALSNILFIGGALAQDKAAASGISVSEIGAGLAIGLAVIGGALGQGRAAAAALEGIARNPGATGKVFAPFILGMALIESLVIFALLIAFVILL